jgi:hypothetical protein
MTTPSSLTQAAAEAKAAHLRREAALTRALDGMHQELDQLAARPPRRSRVTALLRVVTTP